MVRKICEMWREMKAITAMVVVQIATAVLNILFKLAVVDGMEPRVLVAYRLFFATLFMLPLSFIFQRLFFSFCFDINYFDQLFSLFNSMWSAREKRPEFTWNLLLLALLSGLLGYVSFHTHTKVFEALHVLKTATISVFVFVSSSPNHFFFKINYQTYRVWLLYNSYNHMLNSMYMQSTI